MVRLCIPSYKNGTQRRVVAMAVLTGLFCLGEIVAGIATGSLAILSDAFHMISDELSLIIGFIAMRMAARPGTQTMSYGTDRHSPTALVNGVFLVTVALFIGLDAIERFMEPRTIKSGLVIVIVGVAGLLVNVVGMIVFAGHAHVGHNHGDHDHEGHGHGGHEAADAEAPHAAEDGHEHKPKKAANLNLHGVFLHLLGDALGSVSATFVGLIIWFVPADKDGSEDGGSVHWKYYMDPSASVVVALIIVSSGIPLVRRCVGILMQAAPTSVNVEQVVKEVRAIGGVSGVHDVHLWQLGNATHVGTLHIECDPATDLASVSAQLQEVLHRHGIHKTTVQLEQASLGLQGERSAQTCPQTCDYDEAHAGAQCSLLRRRAPSSGSSR
eukprot:m51a1_g9135 hypothetical protein (383) ;mRNA; f:55483-56892